MDEKTSCCLEKKSINTYIERINKDKEFFAIIEHCANDKEFFAIIEHCVEDQKSFEIMPCNTEGKNFLEIIERCTDDRIFFEVIKRCANDKEFFETVKYRANDRKLLELETVKKPQDCTEAQKFCEENLKFLQLGKYIEEAEYKKLLERLKSFKKQPHDLSLVRQTSGTFNTGMAASFFSAPPSGNDALATSAPESEQASCSPS
ncbi:MAG: hypothetical protein RLZZ225_1217 [Pseudomonadota bacterium]